MRGKAGLFCRSQPFSPAQIAGLTGWWDASDSSRLFDATSGGSAVAADGGIARFEDRSGGGRHWTQSTSGSRPLRKTAVKNSLDVVRFDGSDDSMSGSWLIETMWSASAYTTFAVAKCTATATDDTIPPFNPGILNTDNSAQSAFCFRSSDLVQAYGTDEFNDHTAEVAYTIGEWKLFTQRHDGSELSIRVNGGSPDTASMAGAELFSGSTLTLGYTNEHFDGDLAELLTYNVALSQADREAVESYLTTKWAIS